MFSLWAKPSALTRVACPAGLLHEDRVEAPIAVYRTSAGGLVPEYLLIQHGSYQLVHERDQPLLESGELTLYRGVQTSMRFLFPEPNEWDDDQQRAWRLYCRVQSHILSDSTRSFNSIHDRAKRCETEHIRDRSWITDDVARQHGLDIDGDGFTAALWNVAHQSFALERWVAERKFGPHYVVCRTPVSNVRMTTFFTGEHEVRIIDPRQVRIIETQGCRVAPLTWNSSP